jgi:K+-sensing histidine kinase KdpD
MPSPEFVEPVIVSRGMNKFIYVASHGLRSSITAIRWASNKLERTMQNKTTEEEKKLLRQIHTESTKLASTLHSMLLAAKLEEGVYKGKSTAVCIYEYLSTLSTPQYTLKIDCSPDLTIHADTEILETVLQDVLTGCLESVTADSQLHISAQVEANSLYIHIEASLEFAFLRADSPSAMTIPYDKKEGMIGGTTGLFFSLASSILTAQNGSLHIEEKATSQYRITIFLPLSPSH